MNAVIEQALNTVCERVQEMPLRVLQIFNDFFGERRVDMQGFSRSLICSCIYNMTISDAFKYSKKSNLLPIAEWHGDCSFHIALREELSEETRRKIVEVITSKGFMSYIMEKVKGFILVHFPETKVTNEFGRSTIVKNIYIKVPLLPNGAEDGMFTMNRSEYTVMEMRSDYMHSHARNIPISNFREFVPCCLGSGPLGNTQAILNTGFDEDRWNIFCLEISKYVETESIAGTPYHRLENIGVSGTKLNIGWLAYSGLYLPSHVRVEATQLLTNFFSYYLDNNNLIFSYRNGIYSLGTSYVDYLISISNSFIEWVNSNHAKNPQFITSDIISKVIEECIMKGGTIYKRGRDYTGLLDRCRQYIGRKVCVFKGKPVTITITGIGDTNNVVRLLNPRFASLLLYRILRTINYRYGRIQKDPSNSAGKTRYAI